MRRQRRTGLLNYQTNTATLVGNGADKTIYTYTLPGERWRRARACIAT